MRKYIYLSAPFIVCSIALAQGPYISDANQSHPLTHTSMVEAIDPGDNGFKFETFETGINSEYSDFGVGLFMGKFISYSSRKIGLLSKKDPATKEPYTKLYCSDILEDWDLTRPLLFSNVLNRNENLGTVTFTEDGQTMYFTKNIEGDSQTFQIYRVVLNPEREGEWIDFTLLPFNQPEYSFENPHLSKDGRTLYFASNMPEAVGGFDIFKASIAEDGTVGSVEKVAGNLNTAADEKFPHTSVDDRFLFFSSKGHDTYGGYDVFMSRKTKYGYKNIINLGNTINTQTDEVGFIPVSERNAYMTSDREGGAGTYDIYKVTQYIVNQRVKGRALDFDTGLPLANVAITLLDTDEQEVGTFVTNENGEYNFPVASFESFTILGDKDGFNKGSTLFNTDSVTEIFDVDVKLKLKEIPKPPAEIIEVGDKRYLKIDNIQFDYDSAKIKEVSEPNLDKVVQILTDYPEMKVALNAHTDSQGSDRYNLTLSDRRAVSAMEYLVSKGISLERLISKGFGESQPLIDCSQCSEEQHETNRRIEFLILEDN